MKEAATLEILLLTLASGVGNSKFVVQASPSDPALSLLVYCLSRPTVHTPSLRSCFGNGTIAFPNLLATDKRPHYAESRVTKGMYQGILI
jgi:hypothetical protein